MMELLAWLGNPVNSKTVALLIFFVTFVGIVIYIYGSKKRSKRLESYRYIPFQDEDDSALTSQTSTRRQTSQDNAAKKG